MYAMVQLILVSYSSLHSLQQYISIILNVFIPVPFPLVSYVIAHPLNWYVWQLLLVFRIITHTYVHIYACENA